MQLKDTCLKRFAQDTSEKQIIIFGAGVLCHVWLPYLFEQYDMEDRIAYCVDNQRYGESVEFGRKTVPVYPFTYMQSHIQKNQVILVSVSAFQDIVEQIQQCTELSQVECYIAPMMFVEHCHIIADVECIPSRGAANIPKTIHCIWFSDCPELPPLLRRCMDSWRRLCPDYEIVQWNAKNYDVSKTPYLYQAYQEKNWSLLSDYARLDILYKYGGVYFDTDVELIKGIDGLLRQEAFVSFEKWPVINSGGGMGAVKGFHLIGEMLEYRKTCVQIHLKSGITPFASGFYETKPLLAHGLQMNGETQTVAGMTIFSSEYFHPFDYMSGRCSITPHTYAIHHFNRSWVYMEHQRNGSAYYQSIRKYLGEKCDGSSCLF